jgi:hypothetical protein
MSADDRAWVKFKFDWLEAVALERRLSGLAIRVAVRISHHLNKKDGYQHQHRLSPSPTSLDRVLAMLVIEDELLELEPVRLLPEYA